MVTDRASVMVKFGTLIDPLHFLCLAHGIQLAICDCLYKKKEKKSKPAEDESSDEDSDEDGTISLQIESDQADLIPEFEKLVDFVRKTFKKFRNSRLKNEALQTEMRKKFGKELKLGGDCKTRWTSLRKMLCRFIKCVDVIKPIMMDFDMEFELSDQDIKAIEDLCNALEPFEVAVNALCRRDSNILKADTTIKWVIDSLKKSDNYISSILLHVSYDCLVSIDHQ